MLTLSDEEWKSLLQKARISNIAIDSAQVLAIKAGMAIPWNRMRLLREGFKYYMHSTKNNVQVAQSISSFS